jgi:trk system potassium uptake protein TrkH
MRYPEFLKQRYKAIFAYTGLSWLIISLIIFSPLLLLVFYPQEYPVAWGFLLGGLVLAFPGYLMWRLLKPAKDISLTKQEGAVIVVLAWLAAILAGMVPFLVASGLNITGAIFESTSGWTTAGLSILDVESQMHLILFYRSVLQLAGGAGLAIIMLSALVGPVGRGLTSAEGRGEQLLPNVRRSARLVFSMYTSYVIFGVIALYLVGMSFFDAVNHAFTAVSTGGFSTHTQSIGYWDSPAIEAVIIVLMLLGMLNFLTAYTMLRRNLRAAEKDSEVRQTVILICIFIMVLLFGVTRSIYPTLGESLRVAVFNTVAAISTTGFATVEFNYWNGLGMLVLIVLMLMGGGTGSTAGGIKQYRIHILFKGLLWEFRRRFLPRNVITEPDAWRGEQRQFISDQHLRQVGMFVFLYIIVVLVGGGILTAYGNSIQDSLFEFASALSTVGLSIGITAADAPAGVLWVEILAMFLGRLEFFTVLIGIVRLVGDLPVMVFGKRTT